jgi:hypothetical protein
VTEWAASSGEGSGGEERPIVSQIKVECKDEEQGLPDGWRSVDIDGAKMYLNTKNQSVQAHIPTAAASAFITKCAFLRDIVIPAWCWVEADWCCFCYRDVFPNWECICCNGEVLNSTHRVSQNKKQYHCPVTNQRVRNVLDIRSRKRIWKIVSSSEQRTLFFFQCLCVI